MASSDPKIIVKEFLKWINDGEPNITKCFLSHPTLYQFCKAKNVAILHSISKEVFKIL